MIKKQKTFYIFTLILFFLLFLFIPKLKAASTIKSSLEISKTSIEAEEYIDVSIGLNNLAILPADDRGIQAFRLYLYFDSNKLTINRKPGSTTIVSPEAVFVSSAASLLGVNKNDLIFIIDSAEPNYVDIQFVTLNDAIEFVDGAIFTLRFQAKDKAGGVAEFYLGNNKSNTSSKAESGKRIKYDIDNSLTNKSLSIISNDATVESIWLKLEDSEELYYANIVKGKYEIAIPRNMTKAFLFAKANSTKASITGTGEKVLVNSSGKFSIEILAEDNSTSEEYEVNIRPFQTGKTLSNVSLINAEFSDGTYSLKLTNNIFEYDLDIKYTTGFTMNLVLPSSSNAKVFYLNEEKSSLNIDNINPNELKIINIVVRAEDGSEANYKFNILMAEVEDDTSLEYLNSSEEYNLLVDEDNYYFTYKYGINNTINLRLKTNSPTSLIKAKGTGPSFTKVGEEYVSEDINLSPGILKTFEFIVQAKNNDEKTVKVFLQLPTIEKNTKVNSILINEEALTGFSFGVHEYSLGDIDYSTKSINIEFVLDSPKSSVEGAGDINLKDGTNVIILKVKSQTPSYGEEQKVDFYYITYNRLKEKIYKNNVDSIVINGEEIGFLQNELTYTLEYSSKTTSLYIDVILALDSQDAIISGDSGYQVLSYGVNQFMVKIESSDLKKTTEYNFHITRLESSIETQLEKLFVDEEEIYKIDDKYSLDLAYQINHIFIEAEAFSQDAIIEGLGLQALSVGENVFDIKIYSFDRAFASVYKLYIYRAEASSDSTLEYLEILGIDSLEFEKTKLDYFIEVPWEILSLNLRAKTNDINARIIEDNKNIVEKRLDLRLGENHIILSVAAEDTSITNYNIFISRNNKFNNVSTLGLLQVVGFDAFQLNEQASIIQTFQLLVDHNVDRIEIIAEAKSDKALVIGASDYILNLGANQIDITCYAEDLKSFTIYRIFVFRESLSANNYIENMSIVEDTNFAFNKHTELYAISIKKKISKLTIGVELASQSANFIIKGNENFKIGQNIVEIVVTAQDGSVRSYYLSITIDEAAKARPWIYASASLGATSLGLVATLLLRRRKLKIKL